MTTRPVLRSSQSTQKNFNSQEVFSLSCTFQAISQLATRLCSVFHKITSYLASLQSPRIRNILELCLFWNYQGYSIAYSTACLQLVKVSTVFVFLGRGLLEQDSESQEEQYLFEICPVEHTAKICLYIASSHVSIYPSQFTACLN